MAAGGVTGDAARISAEGTLPPAAASCARKAAPHPRATAAGRTSEKNLMPYRIVLSPLTRVLTPSGVYRTKTGKSSVHLPFLQIVHPLGEANSAGFLEVKDNGPWSISSSCQESDASPPGEAWAGSRRLNRFMAEGKPEFTAARQASAAVWAPSHRSAHRSSGRGDSR